ncbi:hypothetical protein FB009_12028 [Sinorhizobium medicae]|nr:hypothetical protein FB009_12028 [Sinorhizobium medicae]
MVTTRFKTAAGALVKVLSLMVGPTAWAEHERTCRSEGPKASGRSSEMGRIRL